MALSLILLGLFVAGLALLWAFILAGRRDTARLRVTVMAAVAPGTGGAPVPASVPEVVQNYALRAGVDPARPAAGVRLAQRAEMRLRRRGDWVPIKAQQRIATGEPGFLWEAASRKGPLTIARVADSYVNGKGRLTVRLLGAFVIADATGPEMDRGEAMRYLAELPWAPDAILGNAALRWRALGPAKVEVALDTASGPAAVVLEFDAAGDIVGARADARPATEPDGTVVMRPWVGRFSDHCEIGGRRIPRRGEVGWVYPTGYEAYWQGEIVEYEVWERE